MATGTAAMTAPVSRSIEDFTVVFHKDLANRIQGNFISSALSAHIVLAMAAYGAGGITAEEMRSALRLPKNDKEAYQGFHEFIAAINNIPDVTLKVANKIYNSDKLEVKAEFKSITRRHFDSESESLDFSNTNSVNLVNKWCSDKTNGLIKKIFSEDALGTETLMVLLNAVYFKGNWKKKFDEKLTRSDAFHISETSSVNVPMMSIQEYMFFKDLEDLDADCVALPYINQDVYMVIIVPRKVDGLKHVENNLEKFSINYETELKSGIKPKVLLSLPKFKVESDINLVPILQELGMASMFNNKANFTGISDTPLRVDKAIQKAVIEVNEEGSEAAAITAITMVKFSMPQPAIPFVVNRPFLFKIMYKSNTLFSGRIVNPQT